MVINVPRLSTICSSVAPADNPPTICDTKEENYPLYIINVQLTKYPPARKLALFGKKFIRGVQAF